MRNLPAILLSTLTLLSTYGAANGIDGEVLVKAGTTGNKALPTSQTTNVTISATSMVTDGGSAVAFKLNSSNYLSNSSAKLLNISGAGTNVYEFDSAGAIKLRGPVVQEIFSSGGGGSHPSFDLYSDSSTVYFNLSPASGSGIYFEPPISDGNTPYTFDTPIAHTSGNLVEIRNNGNLAVNFPFDGTIVLTGTTNQVVFGATNSAPSSAVAPTKWISVQVQGESATYRIPLYE